LEWCRDERVSVKIVDVVEAILWSELTLRFLISVGLLWAVESAKTGRDSRTHAFVSSICALHSLSTALFRFPKVPDLLLRRSIALRCRTEKYGLIAGSATQTANLKCPYQLQVQTRQGIMLLTLWFLRGSDRCVHYHNTPMDRWPHRLCYGLCYWTRVQYAQGLRLEWFQSASDSCPVWHLISNRKSIRNSHWLDIQSMQWIVRKIRSDWP
jgi:hypothetical protein